MESHVYHCTVQSYVSVLSHCPMWDRWDSPMESHVYHCTGQSYVRPIPLSYVGQMGQSYGIPVYHCTGQSYVSVLCTGQSYVSVLSHCPMWDRWDSPMESHHCVDHCTGQSYVSVLSHCPMWDSWDSPMESHVYHCTGHSVCPIPLSYMGQMGQSYGIHVYHCTVNHITLGMQGLQCLSVCLSVSVSTTILALQATRWLMSDTNSFSATRA